MFAALVRRQFVAATPGFSREAAAIGFVRVVQFFLFDRRRHFVCRLQ
jgi:hypothetical protein